MAETMPAPTSPAPTPPDAPAGAPAGYRYADPRTTLAEGATRRTPVHFHSEGTRVAGHVYLPAAGAGPDGGPYPAVVLIGPETYVKEQVPSQYARRLADQGFLALTFDPRGRGESDAAPDVPRDVESPLAKVADVRAGLDYLAARPDVDSDRLLAVAICQGSSEMVRAVADDDRVKALATLAGHYRDHEGDVQWFGGEDQLAARKARAQAARDKFAATGEVEYVKGVDQTDPTAGMPGELVWGWYQRWADAGLWPNRFAVMSDAELLDFESMSASARLRAPTLMFHSDQCMLPDAARRHFDRVPGEKRMEWWGDTLHFQFYDDPSVIDRAVPMIADWFRAHARPRAAAARRA